MCPTNAELYSHLSAVYLAKAESDSYRRICQKMLSQFGHTSNYFEAQLTARTCLIVPGSGADPVTVSNLVDLAVRARAVDDIKPWWL